MIPTNEYAHISTNTTTNISGSASSKRMTLVSITVNTTAAGAITVYDDVTSGTTTPVAILKASIAEQTYYYNITLQRGLQIVTAAASDITVTYRSN